MLSSRIACLAIIFLSCALFQAAITETFDGYPAGGTDWSANWQANLASGGAATIVSTTPLNGGGNYLSVTTAANNSTLGVRRSIGSAAASPYTLTFDWRLDSNDANFSVYNDRIHFGATTGTVTPDDFGTNGNYTWIIGVVGGDNPGADTILGTGDDTAYSDKLWYFYDNTSSSSTGSFTSGNMEISTMVLTTGLVYSFVVTVDPASQTYSASISDGTTTFSRSNMNFRNQSAVSTTNGASNLVFGGSSSSTGDAFSYSLDNINIVPEPSSLVLVGLSGLACFKRRRIAG